MLIFILTVIRVATFFLILTTEILRLNISFIFLTTYPAYIKKFPFLLFSKPKHPDSRMLCPSTSRIVCHIYRPLMVKL